MEKNTNSRGFSMSTLRFLGEISNGGEAWNALQGISARGPSLGLGRPPKILGKLGAGGMKWNAHECTMSCGISMDFMSAQGKDDPLHLGGIDSSFYVGPSH